MFDDGVVERKYLRGEGLYLLASIQHRMLKLNVVLKICARYISVMSIYSIDERRQQND